jgi:hypothetical protein
VLTQRIGQWLRSLGPRWILAASWLLAIAYAFPGYMNWDASSQETQARAGQYGDGHPPLMAFIWHLLEKLVHGPILMLVMQTSLFLWGLYAAFCVRFKAKTAAWIAGVVFLFPPVLTPMTVVWKDAQMAGFLLAGVMLALRSSRRARITGIVLLFLGVGVRHNAPFALPALCLLIVASWGVRNKLAVIGLAAALAIGTTGAALAVNGKLGVREYWWYRTFAVHDIMGTICLSPPMTDEQVRTALEGVPLLQEKDLQKAMCKAYDPRAWFSASFGEGRLFGQLPDANERVARGNAWKRLVRAHPMEYLGHRWRVMKEVLGLSSAPIWEPVCQEFGANRQQMNDLREIHSQSGLQQSFGALASSLGRTIIYRPWAYLIASIILLGYALLRRDTWIMALLTSGIVYEATYFIGAPSPDFRYSHWMVTCCCIAAITIFGERLRAGIIASTARRASTSAHRTETR